ncbi:MAG: HlyD family type I secretion periplasmic adaptor subunit [Gammaproteobacteria bacterium]|nr:HlyD family type I secretion periplasmic adaptor subunit [Gammaproteobacteria bacterium]
MSLSRLMQQLRQRRYLPDAVVLEEVPSVKPALWTIITISLVIIALFVWGSFAEIQETTTSFGVIQSKQRVPVIQSIDNVHVAQILVSNGDNVKQGQPLIQLSQSDATMQLKQLKLKEITAALDVLRWQYYIDNSKMDFVSAANNLIKDQYSTYSDQAQLQTLIGNEKQRLDLQNKGRDDQKALSAAKVNRYQQQIEQLNNQQTLRTDNLNLLNKQLDMYTQLLKSNAISRRDYLKMQQEINSAQTSLAVLSAQQAEAQQNLLQAQAQVNQIDDDLKQAALKEINNSNNQLALAKSAMAKNDNITSALNITAPINGIVKNIAIAAGDKLSSGEMLLEIIPLEQQLIVSANIPANAVSRISVGDSVRVKPLNNSAKFMTMPGEVQSIASNSYTDQNGQTYFRAVISVSPTKLGKLEDKQPLQPGMNVEAYIATGTQSILSYLLKSK